MDLMNLIHIPISQSQGLTYTSGIDGYPAFLFTDRSDVQLPASELFHARLWSEFSLFAVVQPLRPRGGFIFAVVSPSGTLVQFALRVADGGPDSSKV